MRCKIPAADLSARLDNTICMYEGKPVHVRFEGGNLLNIRPLGSRENGKIIPSDDDNFDVSSPPLGYIQSGSNVVYLTRRPSRIFKQGLCAETIHYATINKNPNVRLPSFNSVGMADMISGNYPNVDTAIEKLYRDGTDQEIAISRDVALKLNPKLRIIYVFYKNEEVGFMIEGKKRVLVPSLENSWVVSMFLSEYNWEVE